MSDAAVRRLRQALVASVCAALACSGPGHKEDAGRPPTPVAAEPEPDEPDAAQAGSLDPEPSAQAAPEPPAAPAPVYGPEQLTALDAQARQTLLAGEHDPPIPVEIHYIQSNETRHDLFFSYIEQVGGAFIGVGSDQSFTMMAAARSELAFLIDIDYRVVDLHRMYAVMLPAAETPEQLVDMWDGANEETTIAFLQQALASAGWSEDERTRMLRGFKVGRETVYRHLQRVLGRSVDGEPASWLSDARMYDHVRALYQTGRVRIMPGDLTGASSLQTIAATCKALDVPVTVLYLSNAEEYFKYTPQFRANIQALPINDSAMVLRTIYSKKWEHADLWAYQIQPLSDFVARLGDKINRSRSVMLRYADRDDALEKDTGIKGFSRVGMTEDGR